MLRAILFDFDGVIGDSNAITASYLQKTIKHFGLPVPSVEAFTPLWGLKSMDILQTLFPQVDEKRMQEILTYCSKLSLENAVKVPLFSGAAEVVEGLGRKYKLAMITSRGKKSLQIILEKYQLHQHFLFIIDREAISNHKPHPEGLLKALQFLQIASEDALFIGDTLQDVLAARNAGVRCVIVGATNPHGADFHIQKITELPDLIKKIQ